MRRIMARHGVCHIILDHIASYSVVKICQVIRERFSFCTCHLPGTTSFNDGLFILGNDCCCSNVTFLIIYHNMFRMLLLPWSGLPESCASLARERSIASDGQVCKIMYIYYIYILYYIYYIKYISRNWSVFHCVFLGSVPNVGSCVASVAFKLQPGKHSKMLWRVIGKNAGLPRLLLSIPTWGVWKCHLKLHHFDEKYALLIGLDGICYWENSLALRLSVAVNSLRVCLFAIEHQI